MTDLKSFQTQKAAEFEKLEEEFGLVDAGFNGDDVQMKKEKFLAFLHTAIAEAIEIGRNDLNYHKIATCNCLACEAQRRGLLHLSGNALNNHGLPMVNANTTRITAMSPEGLSSKRSEEGELEVEEGK